MEGECKGSGTQLLLGRIISRYCSYSGCLGASHYKGSQSAVPMVHQSHERCPSSNMPSATGLLASVYSSKASCFFFCCSRLACTVSCLGSARTCGRCGSLAKAFASVQGHQMYSRRARSATQLLSEPYHLQHLLRHHRLWQILSQQCARSCLHGTHGCMVRSLALHTCPYKHAMAGIFAQMCSRASRATRTANVPSHHPEQRQTAICLSCTTPMAHIPTVAAQQSFAAFGLQHLVPELRGKLLGWLAATGGLAQSPYGPACIPVLQNMACMPQWSKHWRQRSSPSITCFGGSMSPSRPV